MDNNHSISNFSESGILRRYVDILSEAGFKAVLCNKRNRDVLIDILNIALPPHKHVRSIAYSSTEIPGFTFANKSVRLDLRCTGDDGTEFIVELQCYRQDNFFRRCVEYAAKVYDAGSVRAVSVGTGTSTDSLPCISSPSLQAMPFPPTGRTPSGRTGSSQNILSVKN